MPHNNIYTIDCLEDIKQDAPKSMKNTASDLSGITTEQLRIAKSALTGWLAVPPRLEVENALFR